VQNKHRKETHRDYLVRSMNEDLKYLEQKLARVAKGEDRYIDGKARLLTEAMGHLGNARVLITQGMVDNPEEVRHGAPA
jgi:hypothetical protein